MPLTRKVSGVMQLRGASRADKYMGLEFLISLGSNSTDSINMDSSCMALFILGGISMIEFLDNDADEILLRAYYGMGGISSRSCYSYQPGT